MGTTNNHHAGVALHDSLTVYEIQTRRSISCYGTRPVKYTDKVCLNACVQALAHYLYR
jgi:hypothetical protein